jgi:hypothetical protein
MAKYFIIVINKEPEKIRLFYVVMALFLLCFDLGDRLADEFLVKKLNHF